MSNRARNFLAFRHRSKVEKALARHIVDVSETDTFDETEILEIRESFHTERDANFDYAESTDLVLVDLVAARPAARFAFLES